ncbi:hypothetical protein NDU88_004193 [Pleurodeles waltl]|uniref:Uncharacterized protein n=1 Tax=Pleurodeles waltl TaxID=8319 RepID=A0AAV7UEE1_PLEWA|nr:hypothetical protein NDU88_004193 [Pleurodeles waltl]
MMVRCSTYSTIYDLVMVGELVGVRVVVMLCMAALQRIVLHGMAQDMGWVMKRQAMASNPGMAISAF